MINLINTSKLEDQLITELIDKQIVVGIMEFTDKPDILPIPNEFKKIGNFELDIVAIHRNTGEIVMLDHDQPDFIMGKIADDINKFIEALKPIEKFFKSLDVNDNLWDDEQAMGMIATDSGKIAGGDNYSWFYHMFFGI